MKQTVILKNKLFLYLTEFFAGMSVMAVELGASRLLAPYFSSSQIVWTIIIGTIMIAMALGNIYGGRSVDKSPNPDRLYTRILIAAIWIALIPVVGKYIVLGISALLIFTVSNHFLIIAAFAACMVIFVFPLFLLGTVTPSLVKYAVDSLDDNGKTVGTLGAFNTIGSIIGTFVPTFVTIPAVGTSITFLIFSGILLVLAIVYFVNVRAGKKKVIVSVVIFALCCGLGYSDSFAFWEKNLTYEGESVYNYLQVSEDDTSVRLSTNVLFGVQSVYMKQDRLTGMYYDYAMAAPLMLADKKPSDMDVLILGMGTGTYATQCRKYLGDMNVEGVEIDEKITQLSRKYFSLSEDVPVTTYDGTGYDATLIGYDESNDIAVLKIDASDLTPVVLGDSDTLNVGDSVVAIGNPLGELTFSLTTGVVSALDRPVTLSTGTTMNLIQTDCAINSGNSGGALFNLYGEVIGITNAKYSSSGSSSEASIDNIGFAIPIDQVRSIFESIITNGYIVKPYIGVTVSDVSSESQSYGLPQGAAVRSVTENGPAAEAGLQENDIITAVNGETITSSNDLVKLVKASAAGDTLELTVYRQGQTTTLTLTVGEQKTDALPAQTTDQNQQSQQGYYDGGQSGQSDNQFGGSWPFGFGFGG